MIRGQHNMFGVAQSLTAAASASVQSSLQLLFSADAAQCSDKLAKARNVLATISRNMFSPRNSLRCLNQMLHTPFAQGSMVLQCIQTKWQIYASK